MNDFENTILQSAVGAISVLSLGKVILPMNRRSKEGNGIVGIRGMAIDGNHFSSDARKAQKKSVLNLKKSGRAV